MKRRWLSLIALTVVMFDAVLLWTGVIGPAAAVALFVTIEAPLGAVAIGQLLANYRRHRRTMPVPDARRAVVDSDPLLRAAAFEFANATSLARWVMRRPDVPARAVSLGYAKGNLAMPLMLGGLCLGEIIVMHCIIPWPIARVVVDLLGVYALLAVLGLTASRVVRPHFIDKQALHLRQGVHRCGSIPLTAIRAARSVAGMQTKQTIEDGRLELPGIAGSNVEIALDSAVDARLPSWPWARSAPQPVTAIRLQLDDPERLFRALSG